MRFGRTLIVFRKANNYFVYFAGLGTYIWWVVFVIYEVILGMSSSRGGAEHWHSSFN